MVAAAVVVAASLLVDRLVRDPHSRYHPVALLGRFIGWWGVPGRFPAGFERAYGAIGALLTVALFVLPFLLVQVAAPWYLYILLAPFLLKVCLAWRSLEEHTLAVVQALGDGGIDAARDRVGMVVSRDTAHLEREHVLSAAYESMTENLVDSIISRSSTSGSSASPGAAFRATNTMDAMLGYRDERIRIGWFAARADDILNFIPARIAAHPVVYFTLLGGAGRPESVSPGCRRNARVQRRYTDGDHRRRRRVCLEKPGVYALAMQNRPLKRGHGNHPCGQGGGDHLCRYRDRRTIFIVVREHT